MQLRSTYRDISPQADRREKSELEVIYVSIKTDISCQLKILENLIAGSLGELDWENCFKQYSKSYRAMSRVLVNNFCTYCSNFERNPS